MTLSRFIVALSISLFGMSSLYAAPLKMRPGKWEVKMQMEMAGMPQQMPAMTTTHCITPEQARDPAKDVMDRLKQHQQQGGEKCELTQHSVSDHTAHWTVECTGAQSVKSQGEITFDNDVAYHGVIKSEIQGPQGAMSMTQKIEGRRIGECKP